MVFSIYGCHYYECLINITIVTVVTTFALHDPRALIASVHFVCFEHCCCLSRSENHNGGHAETCTESGNAGLK